MYTGGRGWAREEAKDCTRAELSDAGAIQPGWVTSAPKPPAPRSQASAQMYFQALAICFISLDIGHSVLADSAFIPISQITQVWKWPRADPSNRRKGQLAKEGPRGRGAAGLGMCVGGQAEG